MQNLLKISFLIYFGWMMGFVLSAQTTCTNIMLNGDFESGGGGWNSKATATLGLTEPTLLGLNETLINSNMPRNGTMSAELGGYGGTPPLLPGYGPPYKTSISKTSTTVNVSESITLSFWLKFDACNNANDLLEVVTTFNGVDEIVQFTFDGANSFCGDGIWHEYTLDLSIYTNGSIGLLFRTVEFGANTGQTSRFYIDDITLEECVAPPPSCPPNEFMNNMTLTGMVDKETDGQILALNTVIATGAVVDFDSGTSIDLGVSGTTFEVQLGAIFCAFIDGCNGTGGVVNPIGGATGNSLIENSSNSATLENQLQSVKNE